jgi:hypothetical protein
MVDGLNDALLRANAEAAAQTILLSPLASHEEETEDAKLAGKVMTGMTGCRITAAAAAAAAADAMVLSIFQLSMLLLLL